jgi:hypothetical protein
MGQIVDVVAAQEPDNLGPEPVAQLSRLAGQLEADLGYLAIGVFDEYPDALVV